MAVIKVCSETPFSKKLYHSEIGQLICKVNLLVNQFTGFYMTRVSTERYFRTDVSAGFFQRCTYFYETK